MTRLDDVSAGHEAAGSSLTATERAKDDLVFLLDDRPPLDRAILAAIQHTLAMFVGIVTPTLVISGPLQLDAATTSYLVSMSLVVSGVATFIQVRKVGPVGSGLLSVQGTSFSFVNPMIAAGTAAGMGTAGLAMIYGLSLVGSFIEMIISRFIPLLRRVLTPIVTGTVVLLIGLSLIGVAMTDMAGGAGAADFGSAQNLGLAGLVLATIVVMNRSHDRNLRTSSIAIGIAVGYLASLPLGMIDLGALDGTALFTVPIPLRYGLDFDLALFIPMAFIFLVTAVEATGDITATSLVSREPIEGRRFVERIKGGILGDGVNSFIAAVFNTFPNTTFSQNNGVIQLTGVASRYVGYFVAGLLVLFGLFPIVGAIITVMPPPVLGGATLILFGTVAAGGIKIIASTGSVDRRDLLILAVSVGLGMGVQMVPDALQELPDGLRSVFGSPIVTGGLTALLLNAVLRNEETRPVSP